MSDKGSLVHAVPDGEDQALCGIDRKELKRASDFETVRCVDCAAKAGERGWPGSF
jgi:hypothetical protein